MFKKISEEELLKKNVKDIGSGKLNKIRILDSIPLKHLNDSQSIHSSVMSKSRHSSIKHFANNSMASSQFSMRSSLFKSHSTEKKRAPATKEEIIEQMLERHFNRPFIKSLVHFLNKDWSGKEKQLWQEKKIQNFIQSVVQRSNWLKDMIDDFMEKEYHSLGAEDRPVLMSLLFKEAIHSIKDLEGVIPEIIKKIPDEKVYRQETIFEELQSKLMEIYDPKCLYSNTKIKERLHLYQEEYTVKKNDLKADLCPKLESNMKFLVSTESYLSTYQHQIIKLKSQLGALEIEKDKYQHLLSKKNQFTPLEVDYERLFEMKNEANQQIRNDFDTNIVQFHEDKHKRNQKTIANLQKIEQELREQNDALKDEIERMKDQIGSFKRNMPQHRDFAAQVYMIAQGKGSEGTGEGGNLLVRFLDNVVTPFSFSKEIAGSLINILTVDKILFDYDFIRLRESLRTFEEFLFEWFIIRTGNRKIAQIFVKNFLYSLKELKTHHKRFAIFYRISGHSGFKKRNMQEDLEGIFFTTHLCWYYLLKLSMMYRKRLNQNPSGYHLFPPLQCEQVFKLPLRKIYDLIQQFFTSEDIQIPEDLTQRIDQYCINEISKFKAHDEEFQKQILQEIHILRDINFDLIAGFILEYIAKMRCEVVEKLLRTIHTKQKQEGNILGFSQFEVIYRRYYKERRAKIEQIYAKLCMVNQHDMLDVENLQPFVVAILEDQSPLRSIFEKIQSLKVLVLSEKASLMRNEKKVLNPNSYENFKERFYQEFYDFYNTTAFLEDIFKIVKMLVKKRLKLAKVSEDYIEELVDEKKEKESIEGVGQGQDQEQDQKQKIEKRGNSAQVREVLVGKLQEWGKIMNRVPRFTPKVLTIQQIIIHNMRRKEMVDASEYAWKTLREILINLSKQ